MTERLYYTDAYRTEFDARIVRTMILDDRAALILDRTCFYPTSGGQPYDTGRLGEATVVEVLVDEAGELLHVVDQPIDPFAGALSAPISGRIDWPRRYDHMQQHSGQHLLSQVFYSMFGVETVSVHFGALDATIDFDVDGIDAALLDQAERAANELVYQDRPISAYFVDERELEALPLRRPPKVTGRIRIVEIEEFDYSACGGTHCRSTAELGPIKLLRQERQRGKSRVTFKCGWRGYADYAQKHALLAQAAALFSTEIGQVPELIERNQAQIKELQRTVETLVAQGLAIESRDLLHQAAQIGAWRVVAGAFAEKNADQVKALANLLQTNPGVVALLLSTVDDKTTVVFCRSQDVPMHMGNLLRATLARFGGSGGGRSEFAQGGGVSTSVADELLAWAVRQLETELG